MKKNIVKSSVVVSSRSLLTFFRYFVDRSVITTVVPDTPLLIIDVFRQLYLYDYSILLYRMLISPRDYIQISMAGGQCDARLCSPCILAISACNTNLPRYSLEHMNIIYYDTSFIALNCL